MTTRAALHRRTKTPQERKKWIGRDELNLADWRISAPTHQQPRKVDGGKRDVIEYSIPRRSGGDQRVTLMAPAVVGLPTPTDEGLLLALLYLAKKQGFESDTVRFSTTELCAAMHRSVNQETCDRIEEGLTRLRALTIKYELAWYDKIKAEIEPVLITGILAVAKFLRRRGRPRADEPRDSYVQWTKNFYKTIESGNLTDIDLHLYFSFSRPGARQLYRHLNKRFHGRKQAERYERDLVQLACGHLGMKRSKYLKRNLDLCIRELEERGYIVSEDAASRYRRIRTGMWRVGFELSPEHRPAARGRGAPYTGGVNAVHTSTAQTLVVDFHRLWSGAGRYRPSQGEIAIAQRLINSYGAKLIAAALPEAVKVLKMKWPDCKTFKGVEAYIDDALRPLREQERRASARHREQQERTHEQRQQERGRKRNEELNRLWEKLSAVEQKKVRTAAVKGHPAHVLQRRSSLVHALCLAEFERTSGEARKNGE